MIWVRTVDFKFIAAFVVAHVTIVIRQNKAIEVFPLQKHRTTTCVGRRGCLLGVHDEFYFQVFLFVFHRWFTCWGRLGTRWVICLFGAAVVVCYELKLMLLKIRIVIRRIFRKHHCWSFMSITYTTGTEKLYRLPLCTKSELHIMLSYNIYF